MTVKGFSLTFQIITYFCNFGTFSCVSSGMSLLSVGLGGNKTYCTRKESKFSAKVSDFDSFLVLGPWPVNSVPPSLLDSNISLLRFHKNPEYFCLFVTTFDMTKRFYRIYMIFVIMRFLAL